MGYAAEKKRAEAKWKRLKTSLFLCALFLLVLAVILSIIIPPSTWKYRVALPSVEKRTDGEMRVHCIDVGQGDATLIELPDGKVALIDGGGTSDEAECALMRYLYALDIDVIDYLVLTHADEDHCGGLDVVLRYTTVKNAYIPLSNATENTAYAAFYAALLGEKNCRVEYAQNGIDISGEGYTLAFLYPYSSEVERALENMEAFDGKSNEYSVVTWLEYNGVSALFTGDLPAEKEIELVEASNAGLLNVDLSNTDILKVGHHGAKSSTCAAFLAHLQAKTAVISCGENGYGHPNAETLQRLQDENIEVYRTDTQGSVIFSVKGTEDSYSVQALGK